MEVACWAHARRYIHESLESDQRAAIILDLIQKLYQVEKQGRELAPEARLALRRQQAQPLLEQIDPERQRLGAEVLPRSPWARPCAT